MIGRYLSPNDIAERLGVSRTTGYRLAQSLPHVKLGRLVRVAEADLEAYLRARTTKPWTELTVSSTATEKLPDWCRPLRPRNQRKR